MAGDEDRIDCAGRAVQVLFSAYARGEVMLDLILLEPLDWGVTYLPTGTPLTLAMKVPPDVALSITSVTDRWARACEVLGIGIELGAESETVLLDGESNQLVLEIVDPPSGCLP